MTRVGVVVFPGSNCDRDTLHALDRAGAEAVPLWHEQATLDGVAAVVLPGGFAYGDYLRAGVIARFSPVMRAVSAFAAEGGLVLGICNGFQVLAEAGLVPGALLRNRGLRFVCREVGLRVEADTAWTSSFAAGQDIRVPLKSGEGRYVADEATLDALEGEGRVVFRYTEPAPNGALRDIAGISSADGRVVGLMPHPEHAIDALTGPGTDGLGLFTSVLSRITAAA